jgi:hypothetical protein
MPRSPLGGRVDERLALWPFAQKSKSMGLEFGCFGMGEGISLEFSSKNNKV